MIKKNLKLITVCSILIVSGMFARGPASNRSASKQLDDRNKNPNISVLNINNIAYWIMKDGAYTTGGSANGTQADYPIFTGGLIFAEGMLWGAKVKNDGLGGTTAKGEVRVGGSTYYHGLKAGRVITDGAGNVLGSDDPANNHVWRVRKDYATADLSVDAANFNATSVAEVTEAQIKIVKDQYEYDWENWPAAWGAPFEDVNLDGAYDPTVDIPGYPGADQTLWTVANDVPLIVDESGTPLDTNNTAPSLYGADPIGIELQITMWGYAFGASDPLGNNIFKAAKMKYMGLPGMDSTIVGVTGFGGTPDSAYLDSLYFTQWSDPDLGTYTDDYVGSDTTLSYGYVYNGNRTDGVFDGIFSLPVPAGGYDFLQGPVDNMDSDGDGETTDYLGMTAFSYFGAGSAIDDPDLADYAGSKQFYNLMEGFLPRPEYPTQIPFTDPVDGGISKFALSGDPVSGQGWIDGIQLPPGDRRLVMASGPFMLEVGDSADVILGVSAGMGLDNRSSVSVAKYHNLAGQYAYDKQFSLPSAPTSPVVQGMEMDGMIGLDWGFDETAVENTETTTSENFEFEGYVIYQLPSASSPLSEAVKIATFDRINLITTILDPAIDPNTGLVLDAAKQTGGDFGVQRTFETDYDEIRGRPMSNGVTYHFAVTAYSYLPAPFNEGAPFKSLESGETRIAVTPRSLNPGEVIASTLSSDVEVTHTGPATADLAVSILNPDDLIEEDYKVTFDTQEFYRDLDGKWKKVAPGRIANKVSDCSGSTVSAAALAAATPGTIDLNLSFTMDCGDNWVNAISFDLPSDIGTVNSWAITNSANVCGYGDPYQNCNNLDGTFDGDSLLFGVTVPGYPYGAFQGNAAFVINYTPASGSFTPVDIGFTIYDDGYDYTVVNGVGVAQATELGFAHKTEIHWNLSTASGTALLQDQTFVNGEDYYGGSSVDQNSQIHWNNTASPTVNGFNVNIDGSYEAGTDYTSLDITYDTDTVGLGEAYFDIGSYIQYGWAATSRAVDAYGAGTLDKGLLLRDIEVRWTGEYDFDRYVEFESAGGTNQYILCEQDTDGNCIGGSMAWIDGARFYDIATHPDPGNVDNDGAPFRLWVPFEVWDMEALDADGNLISGGQQIDITIYDRIQDMDGSEYVEDTTAVGLANPDDPGYAYSFNPYNRMYTHFMHAAYQDSGQYTDGATGSPEDYLTWNIVWWDAQWNQGDIVKFTYPNPIQEYIDEFTFSTKANSRVASNDVSNASVYPNPYYGTHELESSRAEKYVSFNNLPVEVSIDIYSLGGVFVKSISKNDASQFAQWDLKNQYGYPVASGMYIARLKSGGEEKILKIALVQETQVLKYY